MAASASQFPISQESRTRDFNNIFAFGDSYTSVGFDVTKGPYPSSENYEGHPAPPGASSAFANNYVQAMASEFNGSFMKLWDFAYSGAVVDSSLVPWDPTPDNTFMHQVDDGFLPHLTGSSKVANWSGEDSLFTVFFGVNDINRGMGGDWPYLEDWEERLPKIMDTYWRYISKLVDAGTRNIAILNAPAYWTCPGITDRNDPSATATAKRRTRLWNDELAMRYRQFQQSHGEEVKSWLVDVQSLWEDMHDHPDKYGMSVVEGDCEAYHKGTSKDLYYREPSCAAPVNEYMWLNWLHPTWTVHRHLAKLVLETVR